MWCCFANVMCILLFYRAQRRVLTKTMKALHTLYISEVDHEHCMSYRQFLRLRPFCVTEPKASDRNTCACIDHENVTLLDNFLSKWTFENKKHISDAICNCVWPTKKTNACLCPKCCYSEIEIALPKDPREIHWQQWEREKTVEGDSSFTHLTPATSE